MKLTVRQLFAILLFIALFAMALRPIADADFWWHLRSGQWMVENRAIPHADPFSFTNEGKAWIAHEWLAELLIYGLYRLGGFGLLILAFAAILTATFGLVYLRSPARPYAAGFALLLGALASAPTWGVRPQMLTYLFFALFLVLLDRYVETRRTKFLAPLPLLMLLWVNLHAAYALGIALVGVYLAGAVFEHRRWMNPPAEIAKPAEAGWNRFSAVFRRLRNLGGGFTPRRYIPEIRGWFSELTFKAPLLRKVLLLDSTLALCILATLANPNGLRLLTYPFETLASQAMQQNILEWFSPDFHLAEWQPLAWLMLALLGAGLLGGQSLPPVKVLLVVVFGYMALRSMRHAPLFAIVAAPVLAAEIGALAQRRPGVRKAGRGLGWVNACLVSLAILAAGLRFVGVVQEQADAEREQFPAAAADWIVRHQPAGNIFNTYGWGGYLIWRLYPEYPVYIDGRADLHGDAFINEYLRIERAEPGWEAALARDDIRIALLEAGSLLARELRRAPEWELAYSDEQSILFIHK
jgi:hypothetical protein